MYTYVERGSRDVVRMGGMEYVSMDFPHDVNNHGDTYKQSLASFF